MHPEVQRMMAHCCNERGRWVNGTEQFRSMIREKLAPDARVIDIGAGPRRNYLRRYRGQVGRLVVIEIDRVAYDRIVNRSERLRHSRSTLIASFQKTAAQPGLPAENGAGAA
jgi:hypothetical protein